jgi:hypothetical protein
MQTRIFGWALIGGGVLTAIANAVFSPMLPIEASFAELAGSQAFLVRLSLAAAGLLLVLLGMVGLYIRHAAKIGWFSASAFVIAFLGTAMIMAHEWAQVFLIHHIARTVPSALDAMENVSGPNLFDAESIIVASAFSLGWILWSIAMVRSRVISWAGPVLVPLGLFAAPLLGAFASAMGVSVVFGMAAGAVIFSLGWIVLGRALLNPPAP